MNESSTVCKNGHKVTEGSRYFYAKRQQWLCKRCKQNSEKRAKELHEQKLKWKIEQSRSWGTE